jgi:hypothetical protein
VAQIPFNRDAMAKWYAKQHRKTDPGICEIYYLPRGASDREIRFVEVNQLIAELNDDALEPIDFGVDTGSEAEHKLFVLDVTPSQWDAINRGKLALPAGWTLEGAIVPDKKKTRR